MRNGGFFMCVSFCGSFILVSVASTDNMLACARTEVLPICLQTILFGTELRAIVRHMFR